MNKKYILIIDAILILGSLSAVFVFVNYAQPLVIAPIDNYESSNNTVLFEFSKAELILIDENIEFTSPREIYVEDNLVVNFKPGIYYWKVVGALESDIRQLTINSEIDLQLKETNEGYSVVNSGNTPLRVELYENGAYTGEIILDVDESSGVEGDKFVGREDE